MRVSPKMTIKLDSSAEIEWMRQVLVDSLNSPESEVMKDKFANGLLDRMTLNTRPSAKRSQNEG